MYGMKYTDEMKQFILDNYKGRYNQELADLFNQKFNTNVTSRTIKSYKANNKLNSGLSGKFRKGQAPHNKGKKMPKEVYEKVKSRLETGGESTISLLEQGITEGKIRNIQIPILKTMMEATLEQFFQRDVLVQNGISYHEALDEVVSILIDGITI